jgi:hypothetical protein
MADAVNSSLDKSDKLGESYEADLIGELIRQFKYLQSRRGTWEQHWTEIAQRIYPMHSNLFQSQQTMITDGDKRNQYILDSTAVLALQRFGAILDSLLTPRSSFWHSMKPSDRTLLRDKNTMDWFTRANEILFQQRYAPKANFTSQNQLVYKSLGGYGTGGIWIDPIAEGKGLRYKNMHLSQLFLEENHQGIVDRVCRYFTLTARQCLQKFGEKKTPELICEKAKAFPEELFYFIHWVIPRKDRDPQRKDFKGMEYASYYINLETQKLLEEGGYKTFPCPTSRYEQSPLEVYGRSPAMDCLPAIKTLNKQKELVLKQGQLATDPVMLVHDDGIMDGATVESGTYLSGAISADGRPLVQTLPVGRVDIGKELMDDERALINDTFLVTLFQILTESQEMTATEVIERTREKGILLAPTVGRQQSEYLGPMIDRELDILSRQGLLPPMPPFLREAQGEYEIVYDSPITRTQKAEWAAGAVRTIEVLLNVAQQTQDPSKLFYINFDVAAPAMADIYGTPSTWLNTPEQVAQLKQAMAKQQQVQTAIQAAPAAAGVLKAVQ